MGGGKQGEGRLENQERGAEIGWGWLVWVVFGCGGGLGWGGWGGGCGVVGKGLRPRKLAPV